MPLHLRTISLVPSWTETLLACGIPVVGRTRFCIHPQQALGAIPIVGGTKSIDWNIVQATQAELLLLDQEENPKEFAEKSPIPCHATHIQKVEDIAPALESLNNIYKNAGLGEIAARWKKIAAAPIRPRDFPEIPGVLEWLIPPQQKSSQILYVIWKNPWMAAARNTFIGSMLEHLGLGAHLAAASEKYPTLRLETWDRNSTLLLFASEPFPFARHREEILALGFPAALVDGEAYCWFGIRALRFLEQHKYG